ncbi:methylenetetrahydrofolate reductase C-terminal domain-containing protein [Halomonas sp. M4R1S46]|uniref:methylenetetrahydrofolate reductase C-terminal domain-containing protein n=1 Tax=Halomonas sp. M4R1S46 TaxID=2982692 RepID=UPI0021E4044C|nr:methylenetetrahydrofolate reductase C-terminal domain-containing protein [Halomonas sp. M4R1S46]UYG05994.1 methylenetetrahydrofolate reductase C-terminal domain-containing protein [Halomonas sp. M4R1S46]
MYRVRRWVVRHARAFEILYDGFEPVLKALAPLVARLGHERLERPVAAFERAVKGFLFDCQMCGHCVLSATGMACPMNCPKRLRNGPCGGVRPDGGCEVKPEMRCVWVEAWEGSRRMRHGDRIQVVQLPVDAAEQGRSAWLKVMRGEHAREVSGIHEVR